MIFVGIDNGLNGGIAAIDENQKVIGKWVMPVLKGTKTEYDIFNIVEILRELAEQYEESSIQVVLEKAHPRPISGKRACFMTGGGYYLMQGILSALHIGYEIVNPKAWQKETITGLGNDTKIASIQFCKKKWPGIDLTATERSKKDHDGLSDALCMAVYSFRLNGGK